MVTGLHLNNLVVQSFLEDMDCFLDLQGVYSTAMINVLEDSSQFLEDLLFTLYVSLLKIIKHQLCCGRLDTVKVVL